MKISEFCIDIEFGLLDLDLAAMVTPNKPFTIAITKEAAAFQPAAVASEFNQLEQTSESDSSNLDIAIALLYS